MVVVNGAVIPHSPAEITQRSLMTGTATEPKDASDNWADFDVAKWRDAVFQAEGFHAKLYDDTTEFLRECGARCGGSAPLPGWSSMHPSP